MFTTTTIVISVLTALSVLFMVAAMHFGCKLEEAENRVGHLQGVIQRISTTEEREARQACWRSVMDAEAEHYNNKVRLARVIIEKAHNIEHDIERIKNGVDIADELIDSGRKLLRPNHG